MALGSMGYTLKSKVISKALSYLRSEQLSFGGFGPVGVLITYMGPQEFY